MTTKFRPKGNSRPEGEKRLYTYRWQQASKGFLRQHPLCECWECKRTERVRAATVVDHDPPHRGDFDAFWDRSRWVPMNKLCHDSFKQRLEKSGTIAGASADGVPLDPRHPWNQPPRG
jgi:hypothetical protein